MANRYWVGGSGNWDGSDTTHWSAASGGGSGASVPTSADAVIVDGASGASPVITLASAGLACLSFNASAACSVAGAQNVDIYGNSSLTNVTSFVGNITSQAGLTFTTGGVAINGTLTVASGLTTTSGVLTVSTVVVSSGTGLTLGAALNCTGTSLTLSGTATVSLGSYTHTFSAGPTAQFSAAAGSTINPGTSTIKFTGTGNNAFFGGGKTYYNLQNSMTAGSLQVADSCTFNNITLDAGSTTAFASSSTTTVTSLAATGTSGSRVSIGPSAAANFTLTKSGGGTVSVNWATITKSTATPANTWFAYNSINGGGNSGWTFGATSSFLAFF